jgi:hypothetical protein
LGKPNATFPLVTLLSWKDAKRLRPHGRDRNEAAQVGVRIGEAKPRRGGLSQTTDRERVWSRYIEA